MGRRTTELRPSTEAKALRFMKACQQDTWLTENSIKVIITCTWRSNDEQAALYAIGRTKPGRKVTNAKPGESAHNATTPTGKPASRAFDVVPLRAGKPIWGTGGDGIDDNPADDAIDDLEVWQRVGAIGKRIGLKWAGDWTTFREFPHFEEPA